jgi:tetratricopeptide (TPR) repeat protein
MIEERRGAPGLFVLAVVAAQFGVGCGRSSPSNATPAKPSAASSAPAPLASAGSARAAAAASSAPASSAAPAHVAGEAESEDAVRLKKYWVAMGQGRVASVKKQYDQALAAFDRALALLPDDARAYAERGYAQLLAKNYGLARADFDRAVLRTEDPKLLSQIWFNYGLTAEQEGRADDAASAFARSNELNPTQAASEKLAGRPTCTARVSQRKDLEGKGSPAPASAANDGGDFLLAFQRLLGDRTPDKTPSSADEARSLLCASGDCLLTPGTGAPIRLKVGDEALYGAVMGLPDHGLRIFSKLGVAKLGHCGTNDTITIRHQQPLQFRIERAQMVERFQGPGQTECTEANAAQCTPRCVSSTTLVQDFLFSAAGDEARLLVEQWKTPGGKTPWEVSVTGTDGRILGSGCDIVWELK